MKNLHSRIFKHLFTFLYTPNIPLELKVIIVRLLTQILQEKGLAPNDIRSSDPMQMREMMASEMFQLLQQVEVEQSPIRFSSPYLQSLAELMVEMKRSSQSLFPSGGNFSHAAFDNLIELSNVLPNSGEKSLRFSAYLLSEAKKTVQPIEEQVMVFFLKVQLN